MKYLVIGAGGTGGCIGGYLADAGRDVTLIARGKHLEAIRRDGLVLHGARRGELRVPPVPLTGHSLSPAAQDAPSLLKVLLWPW